MLMPVNDAASLSDISRSFKSSMACRCPVGNPLILSQCFGITVFLTKYVRFSGARGFRDIRDGQLARRTARVAPRRVGYPDARYPRQPGQEGPSRIVGRARNMQGNENILHDVFRLMTLEGSGLPKHGFPYDRGDRFKQGSVGVPVAIL